MLSILIPVYNYNVLALVKMLHKQCLESKITFEIICFDDASQDFLIENKKINDFDHAFYSVLRENIGRSAIRNLLAKKAIYENLLFLDTDMIPASNHFISNYISEINKHSKIVYGGILYENTNPSKENLLRWIYGQKRESLPVEGRIKEPYKSALVSNLLVQKEIFNVCSFDEDITKYGYEDLLFFSDLKSKKIPIIHIENPAYHLNLENSVLFLNKTKTALKNLSSLYNAKKISKSDSKIITAYEYLKKIKLLSFFSFLFEKTKKKSEQNLTSENPSLLLFDLYKLGYYCSLKQNK